MNKHNLAQFLHLPGMGRSENLQGPLSEAAFPNFKIGSILNRAMEYIFLFAGVGLLFMLLSGGFSFLTSAGDPKQMESGKNRITWALAGFLIIFVAYWIVQLIQVIFGLELGF
jgi:hypothetical protein